MTSETVCLPSSLDDWMRLLEGRHAQVMHLRLHNTRVVAALLGVLQSDVPVILVAGTNGKGSTVAMLEGIYVAAGYRVGCYTSPHLKVVNERIRIDQRMIEDAALCALLHTIEQARGETALTYFETMTLAALLYFKQSNVDVVILEVGIGGRLDATNIMDAEVAIITSVDLDHQAVLGDTREAIGYEKAGILRSQRPFIYAEAAPPQSVLTHALSLNAEKIVFKMDYDVTLTEEAMCLTIKNTTYWLPLPRVHVQAALAAVVASEQLQHRLPVTQAHWAYAMRHVQVMGRQQWVEGEIAVLYDVAHNPHAVACLAAMLQTKRDLYSRIYAVFSGLEDKDLAGMIAPLQPLITAWYPACLSGDRAASPALLNAACLTALGYVPLVLFDTPEDAYDAAYAQAQPGDLIVVYGSFLTVGAVMTAQDALYDEV